MYEEFFGFKQEPFSSSPDPHFLFPSSQHQEALARLSYGIATRKGVLTLIGECGTGKTTLVTTLLNGFNNNMLSAWVFNSALSPVDLIKYICLDFRLEVRSDDYGQMLMMLYRRLIRNYEDGRNAVVIIDEAQNMALETLQEARQLSNLETVHRKLLQIVLVGQPKLDKILARTELQPLRQRISIRTRLGRLNEQETSAYIRHRLRIAAGETLVFDPKVLKHIYALSEGIPRLINSVCDSALLSAYRDKKRVVDLGIIKKMVTNRLINAVVHPPHLEEAAGDSDPGTTNVDQNNYHDVEEFKSAFGKLDLGILSLN